MKKLLSANLIGFDATKIEVETTMTRGLPSFSIVGLVNNAILESKDRIKSALLTNSFKIPPLKITVNLSPSDIKKDGSHFDLSIALSIALYEFDINFDDLFVFGEVGLDGSLKDTNSIFPIVLSLAKNSILKKILVPKESVEKLSKIPNLEIIGVSSLAEAAEFFIHNNNNLEVIKSSELRANFINIQNEKFFYEEIFKLDFLDVKGQSVAKRGALISASGMHNILFEGSPGSGKSMIAKRLRYILPPLSLNDILENAKLTSLDGKEPTFKAVRNFRSPHHSSTRASIFGGGSKNAKIGEIALANGGILFFDEFPHFAKNILEALREPLEDNRVLISRVNSKIEYDTKFLFISAQNPCPCGNLLSTKKECKCNKLEIKRYKNSISEPLLDRIDLFVQMSEISPNDTSTYSSKEMFEKVLKTFEIQKKRGQKELNGKMSEVEIDKFCQSSSEAKEILHKAIESFGLSFRSVNKILKVSRTIADLEAEDIINKKHILEALSFRKR